MHGRDVWRELLWGMGWDWFGLGGPQRGRVPIKSPRGGVRGSGGDGLWDPGRHGTFVPGGQWSRGQCCHPEGSQPLPAPSSPPLGTQGLCRPSPEGAVGAERDGQPQCLHTYVSTSKPSPITLHYGAMSHHFSAKRRGKRGSRG